MMRDEFKSEEAQVFTDEDIERLGEGGGVRTDDPLAAIKAMRLRQLAVCRLRSEQEMQAMRDELGGSEDDGSES